MSLTPSYLWFDYVLLIIRSLDLFSYDSSLFSAVYVLFSTPFPFFLEDCLPEHFKKTFKRKLTQKRKLISQPFTDLHGTYGKLRNPGLKEAKFGSHYWSKFWFCLPFQKAVFFCPDFSPFFWGFLGPASTLLPLDVAKFFNNTFDERGALLFAVFPHGIAQPENCATRKTLCGPSSSGSKVHGKNKTLKLVILYAITLKHTNIYLYKPKSLQAPQTSQASQADLRQNSTEGLFGMDLRYGTLVSHEARALNSQVGPFQVLQLST